MVGLQQGAHSPLLTQHGLLTLTTTILHTFSLHFLATFFDDICGTVVGVIAIITIDILKASVGSLGHTKLVTPENYLTITTQDAVSAVLYIVALAVLYKFMHKYTVIFLFV